MVNRLSPEEAMYYFLDGSGATTHLGTLLLLDPDAGGTELTYATLVKLVENRLQLAPRYRQVVDEVALGLARPLWVDDPDFDVTFHVRLSALPKPGSTAQLQEFIARIMSRPLDRDRPLWELYLIEGLADGRMAVLTKTHRCLLGDGTLPELSDLVTDLEPEVAPLPDDLWLPAKRPGTGETTVGAIAEAMTRPGEVAEHVFKGGGPVADLLALADRSLRFVGKTIQQAVNAAPDSPLNTTATSARLVTYADVPRDGCQKIAERYECTVNDVLLGIVTGALRRWILSVSDSVGHDEVMRAVLPLGARESVVDGAGTPWFSEGRTEFITDLPVGEDAPTVRLMQVAGLADRYSQAQRRIAPGMRPLFPELGMVPFADVSARAFNNLFHRSYNVPITMGESRIEERYVNGIPVDRIYALPLLLAQRALAISINEYRDVVEFGFLADRNVVDDLPAMAGYVAESYEELLTGNTPLYSGSGEGI